MAKVVVLAPSQYRQGQVTLFTGDAWDLLAQIFDQYNGVNIPTSLAAASGVTGFFPSATGGAPLAIPCSITDAPNGYISCAVPAASTPLVAQFSDPTSWYVQITLPGGLQTIETPDQPLIISAPAFIS